MMKHINEETPKNVEYGIKCLKRTVNCSYILKLSAQWEILESHALADMGISFPDSSRSDSEGPWK